MTREIPLDRVVGRPTVAAPELEENDARFLRVALKDKLMWSDPKAGARADRASTAP